MKFRDNWEMVAIERVENVSPSIRLLEIAANNHFKIWTPGSHLRVRVKVEERTEIRTYSLIDIGDDEKKYRIAVKLMDEGLGGSRYMWSLQVGDTLEISQPHNHFELSRYAPSYTLVAGGVGITPMISMAYALRNSDKPVRLFYGVRDHTEAAFAKLLRGWLGDRLKLCVAEETGPLDLKKIVDSVAGDGELYICGPIAMLETVSRIWKESGRSMGTLRYETFASSGHYPTRPFTVDLPRFGKTIEVAAHQTLLAALEAEGLEIISDCKRGECGLCVVNILESDAPVDHRDVFLNPSEKEDGKKLCACVSRICGGTLTLDTAYRGPC
ncbi:PDR/VanB family oxidoreductase (plasmid) [Cupriavidus pinatubonensis]|uniref:PDR/VanB family oxidoreductase n=1 Tax=Cupriavidus pinatubonensis TaxID=248026 RepID=UPI001C73C6FD|nr:PDR/VanB family oxidoreductase [Cupriavidus pinatubonensis]QYY34231.1 PDR/VanB family oxidoreductase [Cupriavidus pinatubonensis]